MRPQEQQIKHFSGLGHAWYFLPAHDRISNHFLLCRHGLCAARIRALLAWAEANEVTRVP